jgi:hypothetical protein
VARAFGGAGVLAALDALELPVGVAGAIGKGGLEGVGGVAVVEEVLTLVLVIVVIFAGDDEVFLGGQAVGDGILGRRGLAFRSLRPGAFQGVEAVGLDATFTGHRLGGPRDDARGMFDPAARAGSRFGASSRERGGVFRDLLG